MKIICVDYIYVEFGFELEAVHAAEKKFNIRKEEFFSKVVKEIEAVLE